MLVFSIQNHFTVPQLAPYIFKNAYCSTWSSILERKKLLIIATFWSMHYRAF